MKISILVADVSRNCFGRAYILAKALSPHYDVEILGPSKESGIWAPCDTDEFLVKTVRWARYPAFIKSALQLVSRISGDVIFALKPLPSSFGLGLLKKVASGRPLILDIDDWESGLREAYGRRGLLAEISYPDGHAYVSLIEHMVGWADQVTVVSDFLLRRFGRGVKVPHGRDVHWLDPALYDREALRHQWGLQDAKVIGWVGTPRAHKGVEDLAEALVSLRRDDVKWLVVGAEPGDPALERIRQIAGESIVLAGVRPFSELPSFLAMADLVVVPQRDSAAAWGQVPAKLFDAMAMARPIISTSVSDIPQILDGCGVVVEPGNVPQLAAAMAELLDDENRSAELGRAAREKCIRDYSIEAMERTLVGVFGRYG